MLQQFMTRAGNQMQSQYATIKKIKMQIRRLTQAINSRPAGALSNDIELNPKNEGNEYCKIILLKNRREIKSRVQKEKFSA